MATTDAMPFAARSLIPSAAVVGAALAGFAVVQGDKGLQVIVAALVSLGILLGTVRQPEKVAVGVLLGLPLLGGVRRAISPTTSGLDPIVALPLVTAVLLALVLFRRQAPGGTIGRCVAAYAVFIFLGAFNPLQGPVALGLLAAALASTIPLWFLIGRAVFTTPDRLERFGRYFAFVAAAVALYGFKQQFLGLSSNELAYVTSRADSYVALNLGGFIRPFGTLSSGAEYGHLCSLGAVAALTCIRRLPVRYALFGVTASANFLAGSRGALLSLILGVVLVWLWGRGVNGVLTLVAVPLVLTGVVLTAQALPQADRGSATASSPAEAVLNRTISGIAYPFDEDVSTVAIHKANTSGAMLNAVDTPLGSGTGSVSPASIRFGIRTKSGEADVADLFVAFGYPGLLLMGGLVIALLRTPIRALPRPYRWAAASPVLLFNGWFVTGEYATNAVFWALLGALDVARRAGTSGDSGAPRSAAEQEAIGQPV